MKIGKGLGKAKKEKKMQSQTVAAGAPRELQIRAEYVHHIGGRESQQDNFGWSDFNDYLLTHTKGKLAVVADGMGGLANGSEISSLVITSLLEQFHNVVFDKELPAQLLSMIYQTNSEVVSYVDKVHPGELSGATLVVADILEDKLYFASVGDSRIYLLRQGTALQLNREDVYIRELYTEVAKNKLSYDAAVQDIQRGALTNYMGKEELEGVDYNLTPIRLCPKDKLLLMTDGVFGTLSDEEICRILLHSKEPARELEAAVLLKNKPAQDNFTALILSVE